MGYITDVLLNHQIKSKMKITVKEQIEREIEVSFPMSFKDGSVFYHCYSENSAIVVYSGLKDVNHISNFKSIAANYSPEKECTKAEVQEAFSKVVSHLQGLLSPVSLNDNLPTEVLEKL